jgi:UPF0755 protein
VGRALGGIFSLLVIALLAVAGAYFWFDNEVRAPGPLEEPASVVVPSGSSLYIIAEELQRQNVVSDADFLMWRARWRDEAHLLKAGEYLFEPGVSIDQVIDQMVEGKVVVHRVTIPEGLTSLEIVAIVNATELLTGEVAAVPPEGTLLPETYHFERGESRQAVLDRMAAALDSALAELWATRDENLPIATPEEAVILASVVEKETGLAPERPHIAGVFMNRLNRGMPLQSDPTVIYAITKGEAPLGRALLRSDWEYDDPYNTYRYPGLPPGPIANPGRDAIAAVLQPLETRDIYFVADGSGGHAFAETLAQHNRNVEAYRAWQAAQ